MKLNCRNCGAPNEPMRCSYCLTPTGDDDTEWIDVTTLDRGERYLVAAVKSGFLTRNEVRELEGLE